MTGKSKSLTHLLERRVDPESMAREYAMDISATVYERMNELGLKKQDLAKRLEVSPAWVTKIIKGQQNITLKTIARLEEALDIDISYGFRIPRKNVNADYMVLLDGKRQGQERHRIEGVGK